MSVGASELLDLEPLGDDVFRARHNLDGGLGAIFGGQPMVQAMEAARMTAPGWPAHSLSAHFLRGGVVAEPIDYRVERTRDGRRYASRRVLASQGGKPVFDLLCAFHDAEPGPEHRTIDPPPVPDPDTLESTPDFINRNADRLAPFMVAAFGSGRFPIEIRLIDPERKFFHRAERPVHDYWLRIPSAAGITSAGAQQSLLAFLSDFFFAGTAGAPHGSSVEGRFSVVTLNHSLWFHAPARVDEWLLYRTESPWAGEGRGLIRGFLFDRAGTLVASTVQEISIRSRETAR